MKKMLLLLFFLNQTNALAMNLDEFLRDVVIKHHGISSYEKSQLAAQEHRIATDINLSPQLSLQTGYTNDQRPVLITPTFFITQQAGWSYSAALAKAFETGTQASVNMSLSQLNMNLGGTPSPVPSTFGFGVGAFGVSLSQSLWKDFFGHSTRLKQERERKTEEETYQSFNLQIKQTIIDAEASFWDLIYLQEELKQRNESLARSKKIESWVKNRFGNGIGDRSDVLNAEGLVATRELQLIQTQDDLTATRKKIMDLLEQNASESFPALQADIQQSRELSLLSDNNSISSQKSARKVRLDAYLTVIEAKMKAVVAEEANEAMKPDLTFTGSYSTNSFDPVNGISGAYNNIYNTNIPTINLGLKFMWLLDGDLKNANRNAAKAEALAASLKMQRQLLDSDSAWQEMNRRHHELGREVEAARLVADVQRRKAAAEREKLEKGRTITLQVITAEQDAAESELTLTRLEAAQRKLEAQARMFINIGEVL